MTRTEERLTDALRAAARHGQDLTLRPLTAPDRPRTRLTRWLAPVAAAAAVALIVAGALMLTGERRAPADNDSLPPSSLPHYYVVVEQSSRLVVRATATGAIRDSITDPRMRGGAVFGVGAGDGGREFVAAFYNPRLSRQGVVPGIALYSFHLTAAGRVSGLHLVRGGLVNGDIPGYTGNWVAISPDGSQVALPVSSPRSTDQQIVVVNLTTGAHRLWSGGLHRPGAYLTIPSISWSPGGNTLVFLSMWCKNSLSSFCIRGSYSQVRTLNLVAGGRSLAQGQVLLANSARYPFIVQAQLDPDGGALTVLVLDRVTWTSANYSASLRVIRVPLIGGQPQLLYQHGPRGVNVFSTLASDASGQHWLLVSGFNGWLSQGKLHPLLPQNRTAMGAAW